jgi:hypothetical protein
MNTEILQIDPGKMLVLKSAEGAVLLQIGPKKRDYLSVQFKAQMLSANSLIYLSEDFDSLEEFLGDLSDKGKKWEGIKSWSSPDGDLKISCVPDQTGQISVNLEIANQLTEPRWSLRTHFRVSLADLPRKRRAKLSSRL